MLKIGFIDFVNTLPILLPILEGHVQIEGELVTGNPQELNKLMEKGDLDISSVSLFYYLQKQEKLGLFMDVSISSCGEVGSVELYSKIDPAKLDGKVIQVPRSSATSINMLKILLLEECGAKPILIEVDNPDCLDPACQAALVIGDRALLVEAEWAAKGLIKKDLAAWWVQHIKLPAVFGVWVYKKELEKNCPEKIREMTETLNRARRLGLRDLVPDVVEKAYGRLGGKVDEARLLRYFERELNFDFSSRHLSSVENYKRLCYQYGLLTAGN